MAAATVPWAEVPTDILWNVIERLPVRDYLRFATVCVSWRAAMAEKRRLPAPQSPWLMLNPYNSCNGTLRFRSLFNRKKYSVKLPEISRGHNLIGTSGKGWLYSLNSDSFNSEIHMFHPLWKAQFRLPSITTLPIILSKYYCRIIKVVLLPGSASSSNAAVVTSYYNDTFSIARERDISWTNIKLPGGTRILDVILYKEQLYVVSVCGATLVYDLSYVSPRLIVTMKPYDLAMRYNPKHLIESSGDLLLVCGRVDIKIFKMSSDPAGLRNWVELRSLVNHALFLSRNQSLSVSTKNIPELNGNCIYFMDEYKKGEFRAYNIGEESFVPGPLKWKNKFGPSVWFTPSLSLE